MDINKNVFDFMVRWLLEKTLAWEIISLWIYINGNKLAHSPMNLMVITPDPGEYYVSKN